MFSNGSRAVPTTVFAAALMVVKRYSGHTVSMPIQAIVANAIVDPQVMHAATNATTRRSTASASMPP
ncbi:MAG TPA: hypothetical protein PLH93_04770 [Flavobacteriales bacterium]|nr:hypothetical protein [Flavobacteriales bacterium]